jgi:cation:H+ antiporter
VAVACLPIFFTGNTIARWEGILFLIYYVAYTLYLIFNASQSVNLALLTNVILYVLVPLTVVALVVTTVRAFRAGGQSVT